MRSHAPNMQDVILIIQATATKYKYRATPLTSVTAHAIEKTIEWRAANAALLQRAKDGLKHPQESKFR